jgi:hypothetical protein
MLVVGSNDDKLKILVTAVNLGDRATTITNMGGAWYSSRWRRLFRPNRNQKAFIVTMPSQAQVIPFRLEPGAQWMGMADQTEDVVKMIREGLLYMTLWTAHNGRGTYVRIHPKQLKQSKAKDDA